MDQATAQKPLINSSIDGLTPSERKLKNSLRIVDHNFLRNQLDTIWQNSGGATEFKKALLILLRHEMTKGREEIRARFFLKNDGAEAVVGHAFLMDTIINLIYEVTTTRLYPAPNPTQAEQICIVAVGGYGRGELAPYSDIDLLFLLPYKLTPHVEQVVEAMLYLLWDLKLKVGYSTRSVDECIRQAKADMTIRTGILEARLICGKKILLDSLVEKFNRNIVVGTALQFVEAKLQESDDRHRRLGDSRYVIEPNVKDGKGGLRDLHKLFWIGKYVYQITEVKALVDKGVISVAEARRFAKAQKQLWTIRCHLHYSAKRAEDRLTIDLQKDIAQRLGYTDRSGNTAVERFMKHYYLTAKDVGDLTRIFCAAIEEQHQRRPRLRLLNLWNRSRQFGDFKIEGNRLSAITNDIFVSDPINLIRMFQIAQEHDLEFHPQILRLVTQNLKLIDRSLRNDPLANEIFLNILTSRKGPERILRRMNEAQVFGRFIPDFGRVVAQMQYDMYHSYTVDEHTIIMLGILFQIENGKLKDVSPIASEMVQNISSRRELYVSVLLHDIAKGRGGDHSILGQKVAHRLCPRLGMTEEETETVGWLVRWHLLMSYAAFKRDVNDPKTIEDFTNIVQSPERLKLLLILTVADIRAVGPNVWNGWKAALLRDLYWRAEEKLAGQGYGSGQSDRAVEIQGQLRQLLADWDDDFFSTHVARGYPTYWLSHDLDTLARHAQLVRSAEEAQKELTIETRVDRDREVTEITVYTLDHPGLFSRIAGAMASVGVNIVDARITTMTNGMALDTFWAQSSSREKFDDPEMLKMLSKAIKNALSGKLKLGQAIAKRPSLLPRRARGMTVRPRVLIDNNASTTHTVIEINGTDRPGLLHELTRKLAQQNLQISAAKISTYGASIVDVFYVKDLFGLKIQSERRLENIKKIILRELEIPANRRNEQKTK